MRDYLNDLIIRFITFEKDINFYKIRRNLLKYGLNLDKDVLLKRIKNLKK